MRIKLAKPHNWLIFVLLSRALRAALQKYARGKLLDIGCGEKPYYEISQPYITQYIGLEHTATPHKGGAAPELTGTAYAVPSPDETYDTILCTDVLEHLEEPLRAVREAQRVLKPGGYAIYSTPLFWHLHEEPRDFYRYTKHGLKYLFESAGFEVIECRPLSGFLGMIGQETTYYLIEYRRGGPLNPLWWIIPPVNNLIQLIALLLNPLDKSERFCIEYVVVARKKE